MQTAMLPADPHHLTPGGSTEVRELVNTPQGEISHAIVHRGRVAGTAWNEGLTETLYTHSGRGELWVADGRQETISELRPGRATLIPPRARYQYRAGPHHDLTLFVAVVPRFSADRHHGSTGGPWSADAGPLGLVEAPAVAGREVQTRDLPLLADYAAPDGSEIRLLPEVRDGGLSHCTLPAGAKTKAVRHRSVVELWSTLDGTGELARWGDGLQAAPLLTSLSYGVSVEIPTGVPFQFCSTGVGPLRLMLLTMPRWPGPEEADTSVSGIDAWP
ncbi:hypothetical protein [Terrabacter sp. RAF57]|uniref:hypothetical protein n=1 Tax=Terrabacter sp. RAF57 TaxID=3233063 RepID=UPI003F95C82D